jgi:hypothetical protein
MNKAATETYLLREVFTDDDSYLESSNKMIRGLEGSNETVCGFQWQLI